jgi:hypothetical protein
VLGELGADLDAADDDGASPASSASGADGVFPLPQLSALEFVLGPLIGRGAFGLVNMAVVVSAGAPAIGRWF